MDHYNIFPSSYECYVDFLKDFINGLKIKRTQLSNRGICRLLSWPSTFLNDVLSERKILSVAKGVEFGSYFKFSEFEMDYFIILILEKSKNNALAHFAKKKINEESNMHNKKKGVQHSDLASSIKYLALLTILRSYKSIPCYSIIKEKMSIFDGIDEKTISKMIETLKKNNVIEVEKNKIVKLTEILIDVKQDTVSNLEFIKSIHLQYAENFVRYFDDFKRPSVYTSGFINLPIDEHIKLEKRIIQFRNQLGEYATSLSLSSTSKKEAIFQLDLRLFPITPQL